MKNHLKSKQVLAIKALLQYPTLQEAADASGIPVRTLHRWKTQKAFLEMLHQVQKDYFKETAFGMILTMPEALDAMKDVLRDPSQPGASTRLKAATSFLEMGTKYHNLLEQEERIRRLEEKAGIEDRTRISHLEDYFNKKIVKDYQKSDACDPMAQINRVEHEILEGHKESDPSKINLLTHKERMKYDITYATRVRLEQYNKEYEEKHENESGMAKQVPEKKDSSMGSSHEENNSESDQQLNDASLPSPSNNPSRDGLLNPLSEERGSKPVSLSDADILKWDPENYDRIKEISGVTIRQNELIDDDEYEEEDAEEEESPDDSWQEEE